MEVTVSAHAPGDVNGDDSIDADDLTILMQLLAGAVVSYDEAAADVNGDGRINTIDFLALRKML